MSPSYKLINGRWHSLKDGRFIPAPVMNGEPERKPPAWRRLLARLLLGKDTCPARTRQGRKPDHE